MLCVSSGILALLINGGCTAHSMFKIPIDSLRDHSVCGMQRNSHWGEFMRAAHVIWEVSAQHRHAVEAVEHTLRDVRNIDRPFGGLTVFRWFNCHCRRRFSSNAPCGPEWDARGYCQCLHSTFAAEFLGAELSSGTMIANKLDCKFTAHSSL